MIRCQDCGRLVDSLATHYARLCPWELAQLGGKLVEAQKEIEFQRRRWAAMFHNITSEPVVNANYRLIELAREWNDAQPLPTEAKP